MKSTHLALVLYTVPAGKNFIPTMFNVIVTSVATPGVGYGGNMAFLDATSSNSFTGSINLATPALNQVHIMQPDTAVSSSQRISYVCAAGDTIEANMGVASTASAETAAFDVFGYLY